MEMVCSGCGFDLGEVASDVFDEAAVSHGLCESCHRHFMAQMGMSVSKYIEGIDSPVVTVADDAIVTSADKKALELLGKSPAQIQGLRGGDVFECENARLSEGCGRTIHCSACTIRNTVMDTVRTGNPHELVPAYLNQYTDTGTNHIALLISTEKKGGVVFLKIDEVKDAPSEQE